MKLVTYSTLGTTYVVKMFSYIVEPGKSTHFVKCKKYAFPRCFKSCMKFVLKMRSEFGKLLSRTLGVSDDYWRLIQMRPTKTAAYDITPIEIGIL